MPNNDTFQKQFKNPAPCCLAANYFFNSVRFFIDNNILKEKKYLLTHFELNPMLLVNLKINLIFKWVTAKSTIITLLDRHDYY